jgi:hypothetical protein
MRTTVVLEDDVAAAVARLRQERSLGLSEAVNELVRAGLRAKEAPRSLVERPRPMGALVDVTNIAEALDALEGPGHR